MLIELIMMLPKPIWGVIDLQISITSDPNFQQKTSLSQTRKNFLFLVDPFTKKSFRIMDLAKSLPVMQVKKQIKINVPWFQTTSVIYQNLVCPFS